MFVSALHLRPEVRLRCHLRVQRTRPSLKPASKTSVRSRRSGRKRPKEISMRMILFIAGATALIVLIPHGRGSEVNANGSAHVNIDSKRGEATISLTASLSWVA